MPRLNEGRDTSKEREVARRVQYERTRREWSLETVAKAMTNLGCVMPASAVHKIEKGDPPRSISVTEFLAFAQVFSLSPQELLFTVDEARDRRVRQLSEQEQRLLTQANELLGELVLVQQRLVDETGGTGRPLDLQITRSDGQVVRLQMKEAQ